MKLLKEERGISLVEVIASIVLLAIVLLSFFTFFISGAKFNAINNNNIQATNIARQYTAQFNQRYDSLSFKQLQNELADLQDPVPDSYINPDIFVKIDTQSAEPYEIIYKININPEKGNYYHELRKVHVLVKEKEKIISESFTYHEGGK